MTHAIDLAALHERLFLLEHLSYGSHDYCKSNGIDTFESTGYLEPLSPTSLTKAVVSSYTIEIAVRLRILLDYAHSFDRAGTEKLEKQCCTGLRVSYNQWGDSPLGSSSLTLRETLNKIIHAEIVSVDLDPEYEGSSDVHFWNGQVSVEGKHNGDRWKHAIEVASWCKACRRLLCALSRSGKLAGLGWNSAL